ncbi:GyrI-like domain-containing protein [Candidatus Bipolaricaulota bacterium]|nr:GyrI-like domain-containing protein [Candidatus Bipolaricaulota bacterium]
MIGSNEKLQFSMVLKRIEEKNVAVVRRTIRGHSDAQRGLAEMRAVLKDSAVGPGICLILGRTDGGELDVELAVPIDSGVVAPPFEVRALPAIAMFSAVHQGPYQDGGDGEPVRTTAQELSRFIAEHALLAGDDPVRYVYLEGPETHGNDAANYLTEIQFPDHLPAWLNGLQAGLSDCLGEDLAREIMEGSADLAEKSNATAVRSWMSGALDRLDTAIPDEQTRACVLNHCAHHYPRIELDRMRAVYEEIGDLSAFIDRLAADKALFPARIWVESYDGQPAAYIERCIPPWQREAYEKAEDPKMKRYYACFCPVAREAIRRDEPLSASFCNCSGGWFVQMWEAILDRRLRVDVVDSVLEGNERCVFRVHLPQELID